MFSNDPKFSTYDVVIIGGAIYGAAIAWFLTDNPDFDGRILVIERDPTYSNSATAHTNSCIRQQFSNPLNVQISQYGAQFIKGFRHAMGDDPRVPELSIQNYGYMYLADTEGFANHLREAQEIQNKMGAATRLMTPDDIRKAYPFYNVEDIVLGSINTVDEGYWDGGTVFDWWRRSAKERGVEFLQGEVVSCATVGNAVKNVTLTSGTVNGSLGYFLRNSHWIGTCR